MASRSAATLLLVAFLALLPARPVHAGSFAQPAAAATQPTAAAQPGSALAVRRRREKPQPGWREVVGAQAWDLGLFVAFTVLALVSFFRKSVVLKHVTFVAAVLYLGFAKSQLISIVNIFALVDWSLPIFRYSLAWYLLATFTVLSTVLWGRLYCGRICAFGSLTQLMDAVVPAKWRYDVPLKIERRASLIKYGILGAAILYFVITHDRMIYRYIEPFWMFGFHGSVVMWIGLAVLLVATVFVRNLYCRFLCPVGAALGLLSNLTRLPDQALEGMQHLQDRARRRASGARSRDRRSSRASACAVTTASGSTWTRRSARTGSSSGAAATSRRVRRRRQHRKPPPQPGRNQHFVLRADDHALHARRALDERHARVRSEDEDALRERVGDDGAFASPASRCGSRAPARPRADRGCGGSAGRP